LVMQYEYLLCIWSITYFCSQLSSRYHDFLPLSVRNKHLLRARLLDSESFQELVHHLCDFSRLVFLDDMSYIIDHLHLELALHVSNCQLLVHSFATRQNQLLLHLDC